MSTPSVVPALIDALVAAATTALTTVRVYDGYRLGEDPTDSLYIGVEDPVSPGRADSSSSSQDPATLGTPRSRDEKGTIRCAVLSIDGGSVQKTARDAAYAMVTAVSDMCRAHTIPAFGVAGVRSIGLGPNIALYQDQTNRGAEALVVFDLSFNARI